MLKRLAAVLFFSLLAFGSVATALAQSTTASISGTVTDERQAVVTNAKVTVRNVDTGFARTTQTDSEGRYQAVNLPLGGYEVTVEAANFSKYVQTGITLAVNQNAVVDAALKAGNVNETVTVTENAAVLNTNTAEVSTRFDERRLSELPVATNRNVFTVLLSVPGVSQLGSGQQGFANGISFSANGGRLRSNNFMIDGQDINDPSVSGGQVALNNPDAIQEVRITTNQFLAEYGRNSGSVINFVGKSGTNQFHGSAFWFHNDKALNSCSNLDKAAGFCNPLSTNVFRQEPPFRLENQIGGTVGGPIFKDRTFFFVDYQRWSDRALGSGFTLNGAPTEAGRQVLQSAAGTLPQVQALLRFVPAGAANGTSRTFTRGGQTFTVPLGNITGSSSFRFDDHQGSFRIDQKINDRHTFYGRYRFDDADTKGTGQVTPPGLLTQNILRTQTVAAVLNSALGSKMANELRLGYARFASTTNAADPSSETIPSIEVSELGLTGFNAAANRTAIGLAVNLPQFRTNNLYQIQDNLTYTTGRHTFKFGGDFRFNQVKSFFFPTIRGRLAYSTLQNFIDDFAGLAATVNKPLRGGDTIQFYEWSDIYGYAQDEWRIAPNFALTYGLRYELPGDSFSYLSPLNQRILAANGNDPRFTFTPVPQKDKNNFQPRIGFNWNPRFSSDGIIGFLTGGDKTVLRGGYSRTYDANFININLNIASSFPFVASINVPAAGAFAGIAAASFNPATTNPNLLTRTIVRDDFRAPSADQFSLEVQRELNRDTVFKLSYIGTRGSGLFQTLDGNPRVACNTCSPTNLAPRVDTTRGVIRTRANSAESIYHSMQASFEKRLSNNFSGALHYTWSAFIDTASEIFNPSGAEVAVAQDSFDIRSDRARSSYDRPHRLTGNFVYQLPFFQEQKGAVGRLLGGWQVNSFFTFQSGAPFTVLNGADPTGALNGIDSLVGNSIRPNLNTALDVSRMSIEQLFQQFGATAGIAAIFPALPTTGQRVGTAGRNILRADGIGNVDFGVIKNTRVAENVRVQFRAEFFNFTNTRNFGIPEGRRNASAFLNQWATNGGNRRIILGARLIF
jgi:hypothetical protein